MLTKVDKMSHFISTGVFTSKGYYKYYHCVNSLMVLTKSSGNRFLEQGSSFPATCVESLTVTNTPDCLNSVALS